MSRPFTQEVVWGVIAALVGFVAAFGTYMLVWMALKIIRADASAGHLWAWISWLVPMATGVLVCFAVGIRSGRDSTDHTVKYVTSWVVLAVLLTAFSIRFISPINQCDYGVSFPYPGIEACR